MTFPRSDQPDADHLPRRPAAIPRGQRPDAATRRASSSATAATRSSAWHRAGRSGWGSPTRRSDTPACGSPAGRRRREPVTCRCASPSPTPATGAGPRSPRSTSASCRRAPSTRRPGNSPAGRAPRSTPGAVATRNRHARPPGAVLLGRRNARVGHTRRAASASWSARPRPTPGCRAPSRSAEPRRLLRGAGSHAPGAGADRDEVVAPGLRRRGRCTPIGCHQSTRPGGRRSSHGRRCHPRSDTATLTAWSTPARPADTRNALRPGVRMCPTACPTGPESPMAKPNRAGIIIRASGIPPAPEALPAGPLATGARLRMLASLAEVIACCSPSWHAIARFVARPLVPPTAL